MAGQRGREALGRLPCEVIRALVDFTDAATLMVGHSDARLDAVIPAGALEPVVQVRSDDEVGSVYGWLVRAAISVVYEEAPPESADKGGPLVVDEALSDGWVLWSKSEKRNYFEPGYQRERVQPSATLLVGGAAQNAVVDDARQRSLGLA